MKKVTILGASGSIGRNTLEVIKNLRDDFSVVCLSVHSNTDFLVEQAKIFHPETVVITGPAPDEKAVAELKSEGIRIYFGERGLTRALSAFEFDILVNALVGAVGLSPTLLAIERGKDIALANKETLVMAGELVTGMAKKHGVKLIPIDSEHSAIFQCLVGENIDEVDRIILTGSGGPFFNRPETLFSEITIEETLKHPNWKMGKKISVDSATMMNKGLEIIEAFWLFGLPLEKIDLVIHPQSIIHSLVKFVDGSFKAQLGWPDMKIPIQYALTHPFRYSLKVKDLNFADLGMLTFFNPDHNKFPSLRLALEAIKIGGSAPAVLNAANEKAVEKFLERQISFTAIPQLVEDTLSKHKVKQYPELDDIIFDDQWARDFVEEMIRSRKLASS